MEQGAKSQSLYRQGLVFTQGALRSWIRYRVSIPLSAGLSFHMGSWNQCRIRIRSQSLYRQGLVFTPIDIPDNAKKDIRSQSLYRQGLVFTKKLSKRKRVKNVSIPLSAGLSFHSTSTTR